MKRAPGFPQTLSLPHCGNTRPAEPPLGPEEGFQVQTAGEAPLRVEFLTKQDPGGPNQDADRCGNEKKKKKEGCDNDERKRLQVRAGG